jgi:His-Xaa-Ser repeat protein HxsA
MGKKINFTVIGLAAAGFMASDSVSNVSKIGDGSTNAFDEVKKIFETMSQRHDYTLAQHSSHASHASHGSHSSHRSYYAPPDIEDDRVQNETPGAEYAFARNDRSTPSTSVLPSSPAISKKLKVLKGNSKKFGEIVTKSQLALVARGHEVGSISGSLDAKTRSAIFNFQMTSGFAPDGKLSPEVLTALNVSAR